MCASHQSPCRVMIIGGGLSGLVTANRLVELSHSQHIPCQLTVLEADLRWGGVIQSIEKEGCLLEAGADSMMTEKPWGVELCRRLGIEKELIPTNRMCRQSYIFSHGKLRPVPQGLYLMVPTQIPTFLASSLISPLGKLRMMAEPFIPPARDGQDESVAAFVRRRFGREAFERLAQPMVSGIYAADPERLSMQATMPKFWEAEKEGKSLIRVWIQKQKQKGKPLAASGPRYGLFVSWRKGVGTLIQALQERLQRTGVILQTGVRVKCIRQLNSWELMLTDGSRKEADAVVLAVPAPQAASLLREVDSVLADDLAAIPYESVVTMNLIYRQKVRGLPQGAGFVVPAVEGRKIVGCSFSSLKFEGRAPDGWTLLRVFTGGALHRDVFDKDDKELVKLVLSELRRILGLEMQPDSAIVTRHFKVMPQYHVGHQERVARILKRQAMYAGLYLVGNAYRGIGIPDCIRHAEETADRLWEALKDKQSVAT